MVEPLYKENRGALLTKFAFEVSVVSLFAKFKYMLSGISRYKFAASIAKNTRSSLSFLRKAKMSLMNIPYEQKSAS